MKRLFVILITFVAMLHADAENIPFTKATQDRSNLYDNGTGEMREA